MKKGNPNLFLSDCYPILSGKENNVMSLFFCGIPAILIFIVIAIVIGVYCRKSTQNKETVINAYTWLAIVSLVFSIYSAYDRFVFGPSFGSFWKDPLAVLIGVIALVQINRTSGKGKCIALAGISIGALFFFFYALIFILAASSPEW